MKIIGLTGGIASGKSTVAEIIRQMGIPVLCTDELARQALHPGRPPYKKVIQEFGEGILHPDRTINRAQLGLLVFSSPQKRKRLNALVHPFVIKEIRSEIQILKKKKTKTVVLDIPLLYEEGLDRLCDEVIVVYAPEKILKERFKKRECLSGRERLSDQEIRDRLNAQMSIEKKRKRTPWVIDNSGDREATRSQVQKIAQKILPPGKEG